MLRNSRSAVSAIALLMGAISASTCEAQAQEKPATDADAANVEQVIVTGTLLRGVAPTGTNVVDVSAQDIRAIGATDTNQILAKVPQVTSSFNTVPSLNGTDPGTSLVRPNLRNLGVAQGGTTTLVLLDGHRMVNAGILLTSVDPEVIAPNVIERVEIVPDGGSATYGSDAVGGVINLITRKRFDGFQVSGRGGFANEHHSFDMNMLVGKDWGSGSAYLSYAFMEHNPILGRDRDYIRQITPNTGECSPGTVQITRGSVTTNYALPGRTPNAMASCDGTDERALYPSARMHNVFASVTQEITSSVEFNLRAFYARKDATVSQSLTGPNGATGTITSTNPYYVPIAPDTGTQNVLFSYQGVAQNGYTNQLEEFGVTPEITANLGDGWQLRTLGNYGRSTVSQPSQFIDTTAQNVALAATTTVAALNPYNVAATSPAVLGSIIRPATSRGTQELLNGRVILDGSPLSLPGGDVRVAIGSEIIHETLNGRFTGNISATQSVHRNVYAFFGEASIPIVGQANAMPGIESLTLSVSGRYDHYSDFGGTFNPKLGLTYNPVDWITFRGNWGTSFDAPSMADGGTATDTRSILIPVAPFRDPNDPASNFNRPEVIIAGGNSKLKPQEADTFSIGTDIRPKAIPGLTVSFTYYNIDLTQAIQIVPLFSPTGDAFLPAYSQYVIKNPTLAQSLALSAGAPNIDAGSCCVSYAAMYATLGTPYAIIDARRQNLGELKQDGFDFNAAYVYDTDFGSISASIGGTYINSRQQSPIKGQPFVDVLASPGSSQLGLVGSLGAKVGNFTATTSLTHSAGFDLNPAIGTQTHVGDFDVVDLFLEYDVNGTGVLDKDLSFTLNVNNLLDRNPPFLNTDPGFTNGSTIGRFVMLGVTKKF